MQQPRRILYIDDDAGTRRLVQKLLERRGHTVVLADDGKQGVDEAAKGGFDLIAVDHYMPGLDGIATLERLQALPDVPPVVYVTGSDEGRIAVAALKAGAADYVIKTVGEEFFDLLAAAREDHSGHATTLTAYVDGTVPVDCRRARLDGGRAQVVVELCAGDRRAPVGQGSAGPR